MNYRQWKKNYKKRHGYNPPITADKRKQRKIVRKYLITIGNIDWVEVTKQLTRAMESFFEILGDACNRVGDILKDYAATIRQDRRRE